MYLCKDNVGEETEDLVRMNEALEMLGLVLITIWQGK
jgi:hypothetical protein